MKPSYLKELINIKDYIKKDVILVIREKIIENNITKYILGDITADITYCSMEKLEEGDIVIATIDNGEVHRLSLYKGEYDLRDFMPYTKKNINYILKELSFHTTDRFRDKEAIRLDKYFFSNEDFVDRFLMGIGGLNHHMYIGGLAEHTLNVVNLASDLIERYPCENKDIAILAAKLHDIGKIYEYSYKGAFKSTFRGDMEGHIVIGISMLEEAFMRDNFKYSEEFKNRVKGCIVQHHGMAIYGSPKNPNTEEAYIVHFADYIDATMNKIENIKLETPSNTWSQYSKELKTKLFV